MDTKIQTYKASETEYFFILERGDYYYGSDLAGEFYETHNKAMEAAFDKDREIKSK